MMQVMMYAIPVYLAGDGDMTPDIEQLLRWASLVLTLPVIFYSAAPFFRNAWRDLRLRRVGHGRAGGAGRRRRFRGQRLGDADGVRRGLFRLGDDVRLLSCSAGASWR
jgi:hypothetical protein